MALVIKTHDPKGLLDAVKQAIRDAKIDTWLVDSDGDFTHANPKWKHKAWFEPRIGEDELVLRMVPPKGTTISTTVYGVYHARFLEVLLNNFDSKFSRAEATALPSRGDVVKSTVAAAIS